MAENLTQVTSQSPSKPNHWKVVRAIDFVLIIALAYCFLGYASFFTGRMRFLPPNQQRQSTEGTVVVFVLETLCLHDEMLHTNL